VCRRKRQTPSQRDDMNPKQPEQLQPQQLQPQEPQPQQPEITDRDHFYHTIPEFNELSDFDKDTQDPKATTYQSLKPMPDYLVLVGDQMKNTSNMWWTLTSLKHTGSKMLMIGIP